MPQLNLLREQNWISALAAEGRVFYAGPAAQGTLVTGQTSFVNTTPTFQLQVPAGQVAIPLLMALNQSGVVAGGAIDVIMEFVNADRYSAGGTAATILSSRVDGVGPLAGALPAEMVFRTNPTAVAGAGIRVMGITVGQDISTAEGAVNEVVWTPSAGLDFLVGPATWQVFTYAGVTGPTWFWTFKFAVIPNGYMPGISGGTAG